MKAAIYTRVSTDEQVESGYSLDAQKRRLVQFCNQKNYELYNIYSDEGISGHSIKKRTALKKLLEDAKAHKFEAVLVCKIDRLSRNLLDLLTIKRDLDDADVELVISDESIDTSNDTGMTMFSVYGAFAELERKKICQRLMDGKRQMILSKGRKLRNNAVAYGYWYDKDSDYFRVAQEHKSTIQKIYDMYDAGDSYNKITRYLAQNGINFGNPAKQKWFVSDVIRIIKNPIYKGYTGISYSHTYQHRKMMNDEILIKATNVEPMISEEQWDRVNKRAEIKQNLFVKKAPADIFIFAGILKCACCGYSMNTTQSSPRVKKSGKTIIYHYYQCNSKNKIYQSEYVCNGYSMQINLVEKAFINFVNNISPKSTKLNSLMADSTVCKKDRDSLVVKLNAKKRQREALLEKLLSGVISDEDYKVMSAKLLNESNDLSKHIEELNTTLENMEDTISFDLSIRNKISELKLLVKSWSILPNAEKRKIILSCFKAIYIDHDTITKVEFN